VLETIDVELDGFTDERQNLLASLADSDAAGQIGNVGAPARVAPLDHHHVAHNGHGLAFSFQSGLLSIALNVPAGTSRQAGVG